MVESLGLIYDKREYKPMLKKIFFYIAAAGWILSLIVHLLSIAKYDISDKTPYIWALHLLIFVVGIPAMIYLIRSEEYQPLNPLFTLRAIYQRIPVWVSIGCIICFIYALVSSLVMRYFPHEGGPAIRVFSSFWMLFYGVAAAILFPSKKQIENDL